jgi:hypothetical protein
MDEMAAHVAHLRNAHGILVGKPKLKRLGLMLEDFIIKM